MGRSTTSVLAAAARRLGCGLAVAGVIGVTAAVLGGPPSGASVTKNIIVWAEKPGQSPNYIFPFLTSAYFTVANVSEFQQYMFRTALLVWHRVQAGSEHPGSRWRPRRWRPMAAPPTR